MDYFPPDYKEPVSSSDKYFKLKPGENTFRILAPFIVGNVGWTMINGKKKPIRHRSDEPFAPNEVDYETLKFFIACPVWNYAAKKVQVAEFTQSGIRKALRSYAAKPAWGDLSSFDLTITREGEGLETEYQITPEPKSPISAEAQEAWEKVKPTFDLNRLFDGKDPFTPSDGEGGTDEINVDDIPF